jgi:hypothetical protein
MGPVGTALEFRVELNAQVKIMVRQFHGLHQSSVRRETTQGQAVLLQNISISILAAYMSPATSALP